MHIQEKHSADSKIIGSSSIFSKNAASIDQVESHEII
jgi:hypothetical protein